jgi:hypothetical protein
MSKANKISTRTIVKREKEKVTVYGTEKSKSMETGKAYLVSATLAETVVKKGEASKTKPKE